MTTNSLAKNKAKYDQAGAFDYLKRRTHRVRIDKSLRLIKKYKECQEGQKLKALDIGCGDGQVAIRIKEIGYEIFGLDIAQDQVEVAKKNGVKAVVGDAEKKFPFKDSFFDVVFCGEIIEHLVDARPFILEINRILKKDGLLVLTTPNLTGLNDRVRMLFGYHPRHASPLSKNHYLHIRPFTYSSLKELLEKGGFQVNCLLSSKVRLSPFVSFDFDSYWLANIFPNLGAALIVEAYKKRQVSKIKLMDI
ncbi:class I SAM-dependent methyltransferase [Patescibacteria group bacterium]